jgi:hypothetical protein
MCFPLLSDARKESNIETPTFKSPTPNDGHEYINISSARLPILRGQIAESAGLRFTAQSYRPTLLFKWREIAADRRQWRAV